MKPKIHEYQENNQKIVSKPKLFFLSLLSLLFASSLVAQDRTTVNATSSEISDNLDLRAVASLFGDSKNLEDFENRLNDPKTQISNLDLNNDNQVDYLRVIESVEGNTHLIVVQSVLGRDTFQDVATIEVEKDSNNRVQVQVVGDVYMYGTNYIYEPVYVSTPIIYTCFWAPRYTPYYSSWYWDYYPTYYTFWNPCPIFRYRHNIGVWINFNNQYHYSYTRRCEVAYNNYYGRRSNGYEKQYPNRSFSNRNSEYSNRRELEIARPTRDVAYANVRNSDTRNNATAPRNTDISPRISQPRNNATTPRNTDALPRTSEPRNNAATTPRNSSPRENSIDNSSPRNATNSPRQSTLENASPRNTSSGIPRNSAPRQAENLPQRSYEATPRQSNQQVNIPRENSGSSRGNSEPRSSRR